jgi:hypothetical protein
MSIVGGLLGLAVLIADAPPAGGMPTITIAR